MTGSPSDYQAQYLRGDPEALGRLYQALVLRARPVCWALAVRQCGIWINPDRVTQISHDAASRIVERYLRHEHYEIASFPTVIRLEVLHALTEGGHGNRPTRKMVMRAGSLSPSMEDPKIWDHDDPSGYLQDLLDDHERGRDIVLALVRGTTYRKAIVAVREIASRQWIYDHAIELRYVWKLTRRRRVVQADSSDDAGPGGGGRGKAAVQGVWPDVQRRRQRAAENVDLDRRG